MNFAFAILYSVAWLLLLWIPIRSINSNIMIDQIESLRQELNSIQLGSAAELEAFRLKFLSRKGLIPAMFD